MVEESRMHRLRVGDVVEYHDLSTWPPTVLTGPVVAFANEVGSYLEVDLNHLDTQHVERRVLTEDEVKRVA